MKEYAVVRNFITLAQCNQMVDKLDNLLSKGLHLPPDDQCPSSPAFYGVFNNDSIQFLPQIEHIVDKQLYPTYTYARKYMLGEMLLPHVDREECEYSFTLSLKYDKEIWPIYLQTSNGVQEIILDNGDILIYKGIEMLHWRMRLENQFHYQSFFHYVDKDGLYSDKRYDGQ